MVVAVVLYRHGRIGLFRRSARVQHDQGCWHCITGFVDPGQTPEQQAVQELREETGLSADDVADLRAGVTLRLPDDTGRPWTIHTFRATTRVRELHLNEEHDCYRWVREADLARLRPKVEWLSHVLSATDRP